jgi:hypothetical protein
MRRLPLALVALVLSLPVAVQASDEAAAAPAAAQTPLRGADCLDPARTRSYLMTGDKEVIVDAGKRKYRLSIGQSCPALSYTQAISFRGDQIDGRLCGGINDAVVTSDYPCKVDRIELITDEQYRAASDAYVAERKAKRDKKADQ